MATSEIELCNLALSAIGQDNIVTLSPPQPDGPSAEQCVLHYAKQRDTVLRSHWWNAATKRVTLALISGSPIFGYTFAYQLPTDYIRLCDVNEDGLLTFRLTRYRVEGRQILTHDSTGNAIYVHRLTNVSQMDEGLKDAIVALLAAKMCIKLTGDETRKRELMKEFEEVVNEARAADSTESGQTVLQASSWVNARFTGVHDYGFRKIDVG